MLAQREIPRKNNEITAFASLLDALNLSGMLVSADALHTQRAHARYLVEDRKPNLMIKNIGASRGYLNFTQESQE